MEIKIDHLSVPLFMYVSSLLKSSKKLKYRKKTNLQRYRIFLSKYNFKIRLFLGIFLQTKANICHIEPNQGTLANFRPLNRKEKLKISIF